MRRMPIVALLFAGAVACMTACSNDSSPSQGAAPVSPGAPKLDTAAYCVAAKQMQDAAPKITGNEDADDFIVALTKATKSAPPEVSAAYGRIFLVPGDQAAARKVIDDYNKATCGTTIASS
jgi:hypothetical protein